MSIVFDNFVDIQILLNDLTRFEIRLLVNQSNCYSIYLKNFEFLYSTHIIQAS